MAEVGPRDVDAWKILARQALEPNPFFEPEFVLPLAAARPQDDVHLLVVDRGGEWLFCMPVVMRWGWHKVPVPVLSTWLSQYTFLGTPLVASTSPDVLSTLLQGVKSLHSGLLMFEWLGGGGAVSARLSQAASEFGSPVLLWERFERAPYDPLSRPIPTSPPNGGLILPVGEELWSVNVVVSSGSSIGRMIRRRWMNFLLSRRLAGREARVQPSRLGPTISFFFANFVRTWLQQAD
jgi:hypothetical protein